jgi:hypothetical protein
MTKDPFDAIRNDPEKWAALGRLERTGCVGKHDADSIHVELRPSYLKPPFIDEHLPQAVADVNTVGIVAIVDLSETGITDAALPYLKLLRNLKQLWLTGTRMTDEAVDELRKSLRSTSISFLGSADDEY